MRKYFFLILFFALVLTVAGCAKKQGVTNDNIGKRNLQTEQNRQRNGFASSTWQNLGEKGGVKDLDLGEKITVMGSTNQDGSINASRIMLGEMPKMERPNTTSEQFQNREGNQAPANMDRGDNSRFGNNGDRPSGTMNRNFGAGMFSGEILKIDINNFILKTEKEGTKIIYFTPGTEIYIFSSTTLKENVSTDLVE